MSTVDSSTTSRTADVDVKAGREGTYRLIIRSLKSNPAYLLMFSIGLLGGALGLGTTTYGIVRADPNSLIVGAGIWVLLLAGALLTIKLVESRRIGGGADAGSGLLLAADWDDTARHAFLAGGTTEKLSGRWRARWFAGEGERRQIYAADPPEEIDVSAHGSVLSCRSFDPTTHRTYWLFGRGEENDVIALVYWSQREPGIAALSGVVLLRIDRTFEGRGRKLTGWWRGFTREDEIAGGETEWEKLG